MKHLLNQIEELHKKELENARQIGYFDLLNELVENKIIQRSGTWLSIKGERIGQLENGAITFHVKQTS